MNKLRDLEFLQNVQVSASSVTSGTKTITSNGTHDVTSYRSVSVNVSVDIVNRLRKVSFTNRYNVPVTNGKTYIGHFHRGGVAWSGYTVLMKIGNAEIVRANADYIKGGGHGDDINYGAWVIELYEIQ